MHFIPMTLLKLTTHNSIQNTFYIYVVQYFIYTLFRNFSPFSERDVILRSGVNMVVSYLIEKGESFFEFGYLLFCQLIGHLDR